MKNKSKKKLLLLAVFLLVVLVGCTRNTDSNGLVIPERMISLSTSFSQMISGGDWFSAIFVWPIAQLINFLNQYVGIVWAIAIATIAVNALTLPLTAKSTAGTQKMQMMQPEIDKINKKYEGKNDQNSLLQKNNEIQKLYQKYDINPMSTLLGTFITFPIIIAMWNAVQRAEAVAYGVFLGMDLQITPMAGFQSQQWGYVVIFILMGIMQFISMKLPSWIAKQKLKEDRSYKSYAAPKKKSGGNDTMMLVMWVFIMFISVNWPTAMSVYWFFSSLVTIVKTLYIDKFHTSKDNTGK